MITTLVKRNGELISIICGHLSEQDRDCLQQMSSYYYANSKLEFEEVDSPSELYEIENLVRNGRTK